MIRNYQICTKTIMDTSDPNITFDSKGISNHVREYELGRERALVKPEDRENQLNELVSKIKAAGQGKEYDCIIGLSGGADSSYVAYLVKQLGLRPLAVHLDNGWNSELAVKNIENIVKKCGFDLFTYVINWDQFKDLQLAYLRSSVVDIEVLTDNAISVIIDKLARKHKIKYFLSGTNIATEAIMPASWFYNVKYDSLNIKAIHKRFGRLKDISTFPIFNAWQYVRYRYFGRIKTVSLLNYYEYTKKDAIKLLERELDWKDYGGKHWESKFTQFYQTYILPKKFNVDKRRAFLSCLVLSNQITRDEALEEISKEIYPEKKLKEDIEYFKKRFDITDEEMEKIMSEAPRSHYDYPSYDMIHKKLVKIMRIFIKRK